MTSAVNPRRSCLSVPASSEKLIAKALASAADEVIIDLEDAVAISMKDKARHNVIAALRTTVRDGIHVTVRVNAPGSHWADEDIIAMARLPRAPDSIMVPKAESPSDLAFAMRLLDGHETVGRTPLKLQALIESALGLISLRDIVHSAARLEALVIGYADLAADLRRDTGSDVWGPAREQVLWCARSAGIRAVDGPWLGVHDDAPFRASVELARTAGFDAKWVLHPTQIAFVNESFAPTPDEVAWAKRVVDALDKADTAGSGVIAVAGQMIDEAVAVRARRILALAS